MKVLALDDDQDMLLTISMVLEDHVEDVITQADPMLLENLIVMEDIGVVILDMNFRPGFDRGEEGMVLIKKILEIDPWISIIVLTAHSSLAQAVKAVKLGAFDFLEKPFQNEKLITTVIAAIRLSESQRSLEQQKRERENLLDHYNKSYYGFIGQSESIKKLVESVEKIAETDASVLIIGEHGTGKEMLARAIHQRSGRSMEPFIHADLSSIQASLFESTLFGYKKGAFTDAKQDKPGLMELANHGTLLLDHIDELPIKTQAKLLSVLQSRVVTRLGDYRTIPLDIRIISVADIGMADLIAQGSFREDLYYRINTITLEIPPLRERKSDIPLLMEYFLATFSRKYGKEIKLTTEQIKKIQGYAWPGNVRELMHTVERAVILGAVDFADLIDRAKASPNDQSLAETEKEQITQVLKESGGNISNAAKNLGIGRNTLYRKMKKYGL